MNLYRNFGNIMETWVTEGKQCSDSELLDNIDEDSSIPSSGTRTELCSESLDSGVETASSDTSVLATTCFASTENAEIDAFLPERESNILTPATPTSQSPVFSSLVPYSFSSLSPHLCPSRPREGSNGLHLEVDQIIERTDSMCMTDKPKPLTVEEVLRRQTRASLQPKRHTSHLLRGQRSQSFGQRSTVNPTVPIRQMSEMWTQRSFMGSDKQRPEEICELGRKELSPGLRYLEQLCQTLEEIARQQLQNQVLQIEMDALQEDQDTQSDSKTTEADLASCQRHEDQDTVENRSSEPQQQKGRCGHFRQRSASDTMHLRRFGADCRGQHLNTFDLVETAEKNSEYEENTMEGTNKSNKKWKRDGSKKSQQMQLPEKNSARRRLSQLFRRRKKDLSE
ncbi:uncharacterized protein si:dkey-106l3.7 isoform X2 [Channa argus]|uniref:uncharacterized protein si:dkey-106l3.7 isoform X2 n=1 Tax=Channa argus TaxID=215402 RepID=UPI002945FC03|nr:hypothetical protein Q8A73_019820 [Channa argus]